MPCQRFTAGTDGARKLSALAWPTKGLAWIEIGGSRSDLAAWRGDAGTPADFPFDVRYIGGSPGLYGLDVDTDRGTIEIHRPPVFIDASVCPIVEACVESGGARAG